MEEGWSSSQPRGPLGLAIHYAEHIKNEVIELLAEEDTVTVLKIAADAARSNARTQLRAKVITANKAAESLQFREWCQGYVRDFIVEMIRDHDSNHHAFLQSIVSAKSRNAKTHDRTAPVLPLNK